MAKGSWLMPQGSWLMANKKFAAKARGLGHPAPNFRLAMSHEPWATSLEAWAMSREPLTIDNRLIDQLTITSNWLLIHQ